MKRVRIDNSIRMVAEKTFKGKNRQLDFFLIMPDKEKLYAFSKGYTRHTYEMCKSGISVNALASKRSRDEGVMRLVRYTNYIMPYLAEIYDLPTA